MSGNCGNICALRHNFINSRRVTGDTSSAMTLRHSRLLPKKSDHHSYSCGTTRLNVGYSPDPILGTVCSFLKKVNCPRISPVSRSLSAWNFDLELLAISLSHRIGSGTIDDANPIRAAALSKVFIDRPLVFFHPLYTFAEHSNEFIGRWLALVILVSMGSPMPYVPRVFMHGLIKLSIVMYFACFHSIEILPRLRPVPRCSRTR